ncbi:hypothetical protein [Marinibactrum halimedae]|uniref:WD40-like Beta Propeller Repeat n=1 Tax=Marinibactrum halimedae TaxID=1444977 RepID=A0AA37T1C0_9GAMM|nr:hypothetical protein [Marinibactrum halimedae]MCD9460735.1 hypothetical protein [Marinibactrum halimedae]GLS25139.1 hypothetical protein GCM10007877_08530 [Marinibactrum halimedae]
MNRVTLTTISLFSILLSACNNNTKDGLISSTPLYLGQNPPGLTPELFAPEIIRTEFREAEAAISPDLKSFYFRRRGGEYKYNTLVVVEWHEGQWTESVIGEKMGEPFLSADGQILHMGRKYMRRTESGWSDAMDRSAPLNNLPIMRLTSSLNGTYYFDDAVGEGNIRFSPITDGKREKPRALVDEIDMGPYRAHPYIAPDESYLIWDDQRASGFGRADLYISFRQQDGSWGPSINLGDEINTEYSEAFGSVSPDGKYFFFHRSPGGDKGDIFWVDAQFIDILKPKGTVPNTYMTEVVKEQ